METGLSVTLLMVFVLTIRRSFAHYFGARAAYALWLMPIIRVFMPTITVPRILPEAVLNQKLELPSSAPPFQEVFVTPDIIDTATRTFELEQLFPFVLGVWIIGAVIFFLYQWLRQAAFMDQMLYKSEPAQGLESIIQSSAKKARLKHIPKVKIADDKCGPLVSGLLRPVIILPIDFKENYSQEQQYYALLHEFMHIKRGDLIMATVWFVFRSLNWPNPLVHYAVRHFRSDQEAACDASVVKLMGGGTQTLTAYAGTLVHAAKLAGQKGSTIGRASPQQSQLALTIHHPLKERLMILRTHRKTPNWSSRIAAAIMIIGVTTLSAPLTQATSHPDEELAGKHETHNGKSVIKRKYIKDGKRVSEHYEINVEGDNIRAFKVGPSGKKTEIDVEDIEGVDIAALKRGNSHSFIISDDDGVKFMSREEFKKWAETEYPEWKENDFVSWLDGDFKAWVSKQNKDTFIGKFTVENEEGQKRLEFRKGMKSTFPQLVGPNSDGIMVFRSDDPIGLDVLKNLQGLETLDGESLKHLGKLGKFSFFTDDEDSLKLKMKLTESKLDAAMALIEEAQKEAKDSRKVSKAKRELEKARRALKEAERTLGDN